MRWLLAAAVAAVSLFNVAVSLGQNVQQSGTVTVGQAARWVSNGIIGAGGTAADGLINALGITNNGLSSFCISSARATAAGRQQMCFGVVNGGASVISVQNYGSQSAQSLKFNLNGTELTLPSGGGTFLTGTGSFIAGNLVSINSTAGVLQDAGISLATGTLNGIPYYSATTALTSLGAGTNGQVLVGTTSAAPNWRTLSGDVSAVSAAGAVTLSKVNGVTFPSSFSANGVLYASSTTAVTSTVSSNTGYCLLSQGLSSAPIWAACASGSGSAGGSNTQVQFNSSTSLGGSANLTWVSPALTLGVAGTTTGQLALASSTATGTVTVQAPGVSTAYNFNFPTGAGTTGQPMISGGGASTPNTFGTLGIFGGGTNCAAASGTCLDNITGFSSTGYVNRTGSGTYAFSTVIPVSGGGTNLASGTSGGVLAYTAAGVLASSGALAQYGIVVGGGAGAVPATVTNGSAGQILIAQTSANPSWNTLGTDATISSSGALTIANSAVTNAKLANAAAFTFKGNVTSGAAAPTDFTPGSLTQKASPAAGDYIVIADNAASGALKYATVASVSAAGSVASLNGLTGALNWTVAIQVFTVDGTYTPTSGMKYAIVEAVGGGGAGGSSAGSVGGISSAGGGGSGGYARGLFTAAAIGASKAVDIGAAGAAGSVGNNPGGNGAATTLGTTLLVANGGTGGGGAGVTSGASGGAGGTAGTGDFTTPGQSGGSSFGGAIVTITGLAGNGGDSLLGTGGRTAQINGTITGGAGVSYGGGGGGGGVYNAAANVAGGAGYAGFMIITEYIIN